MESEHYCLRWNNHQNNLLGVFSQLLHEESLVDVTLACSEGHSIRAHKVVLSACSSYFQSLFIDHPSRHPIVILKDVCFAELRTLIEFMYRGEVNVEYCQLSTLLKTAESLKVKGLAEMTQDLSTRSRTAPPSQENETSSSEPPAHTTALQQRLEASPTLELPNIKRRLSTEDERSTSPRPQTTSPPPDCPEPSNLSMKEDRSPSPPDVDDVSSIQSEPSDMTLNSRIPSPLSSEPVPGPSGLPPVQQVPLSLKKEVDWDRSDDKSTTGESSSDFRHAHDPENSAVETSDSRALYPCMYCGVTFPHQSKLTRHILSHSLESLKYREHPLQHSSLISMVGLVEPVMESGHYITQTQHSQVSLEPHPLPPDVQSMDIVPIESPQTALCKFCGKSFPDVSTLITHLPVHTGDRPFKCEFCGKAFKLRHHMKDHCRVHTGERPFKCSICGKTFSRSTILKAHEKTHYPKYTRKFLSSPNSPDDERRPPDLNFTLPCDLSSATSDTQQMYLPRSPSTP